MTDENDPHDEPEPGSTEWLLAQLSGGRLDSRRERREAQAELEARGVQFDLTTGAITLPELPGGAEQPGESEQPPVELGSSAADDAAPLVDATASDETAAVSGDEQPSGDERPKARFSWETGTLQAVGDQGAGDTADADGLDAEGRPDADSDTAADAADGADAAGTTAGAARDADLDDDTALDGDGSLDDASPLTRPLDSAPAPVSAAAHPNVEPRAWFDDPTAVPLTFESTFTVPAPSDAASDAELEAPFRWNLLPTADADPALGPALENPGSAQPAMPPLLASAAPLIAPKPLSPTDAASTDAPPPAAATPPVDAATVADPAPAADESPAADSSPAPADLPLAEPEPTAPDAPDAPESVAAATTPTLLPPGTTAHEFDPFAQDLFAPEAAAGTPVPSVDEFTIPDEERAGQASVPTQAIDTHEFLPTQAMDVQEFLPTQAMPTPADAENPPTQSPARAESAAAGGATAAGADGQPADPEVSSTWTDITDLLGAQPETVENSIVPEWPPPEGTFDGFAQAVAPAADAIAQAVAPAAVARQAAERPDSAPVEHRRRLPVNRWLLLVVAILIAVLVAVLLFAVGRAVASGHSASPAAARTSTTTRASASVSPSPVASPSVTPTATAALPATGTLPAGQTYQWDQLRGGECINPFGGAWAQQYAVVDCTSQHAAQLVYTAPYSTNPAAAFPGEQAIASQINLLCSKPGVIDMTAAGVYSDMQIVASYPVTAAQWAAGQRNYYCFVTRASGQPLTSSVQGPGPGQ